MRELFETLGHIRIAFDVTPSLEAKIARVYEFKSAEVRRPEPTAVSDQKSLEKLEADARKWIQEYVQTHFTTPIEELLRELRGQMPK